MAMRDPLLTVQELERRLSAEFPETFYPGAPLSIEKAWHGGCCVKLDFAANSLRPGGTISGPTMMMLADVTMYIAVLASIGWEPLAVTTNLNINFLRKPAARALIAEARLIKLGKQLAVGDVSIRSEGEEALVAHATSTYAIPPRTRLLPNGNITPKL
jgi:uncharacterized protein (TIGR00369 family)